MDRTFAIVILSGFLLMLMNCAKTAEEPSVFRVGDFVEVEEGFLGGCRGMLVQETGDGYIFYGECLTRAGKVIGPVEGLVKGSNIVLKRP